MEQLSDADGTCANGYYMWRTVVQDRREELGAAGSAACLSPLHGELVNWLEDAMELEYAVHGYHLYLLLPCAMLKPVMKLQYRNAENACKHTFCNLLLTRPECTSPTL